MLYQKLIISFICLGLLSIQAQNKRHDILVSSAGIQTLYRDCANFINISVPDLCSDYNPVCSSSDADIQQSTENSHKFMIVPQGKTCTLSVSNNMGETPQPIGDISFKVIDPPKPKIEILVNGQKLSSNSSAGKGSSITIKILPDPIFAIMMGEDAKYRIGRVEFFKGACMPAKVGEVDVSNHDLGGEGVRVILPSAAFEAASGMRIFIQISDVYRINYKGEKKEDTRFTLYEKSISVITR